ncbi:MAG: HEAT repeat domain-containing protein, partial [Candidatus Zixiibacteriota bacterium]
QGFAYGFRPYTSGGIGAIVDFGGNDTYVSDIYGQGSSYWWSLGVLFDDGGSDQYISYQYAQGAGIHMSLGLLLDQDGDDFYRGKGLMQGCGHDYGCGMIVDRHGNDIYKAYDLSQAAGSANGIGILIDDRGDDAYFVMRAQNTQGYGNPRRDFGSIGMFMDLEGEDRYVGNGADKSIWKTDSRWGGGMDIDFVPSDTAVETASSDSQAVEIPPVSNIEEKIDKLFVIASSGELKYRGMVEPAIDSIAAMGAAAVPRLVEKYDTKVARENHTINRILVKIGKEATPYLVESLRLNNPEQVSRICRSLGEIKDSAAVDGLVAVTANSDWRVRSNACGALGKIGDQCAGEAVAARLSDTVEVVRKSAAVACGALLVEEAVPGLVHMLGDDFYGAALCASEALVKFGEKVIHVLADSLDSRNPMVGNLGCTTLGMIGGISAAAAVASQLTSESPVRRALAVEGILLSNSSVACGYVELINETEEDPTVRFYIEKVLEKYAP